MCRSGLAVKVGCTISSVGKGGRPLAGGCGAWDTLKVDPAGSASEETDSDSLKDLGHPHALAKRALFLSACFPDGCTSAVALGSLRAPDYRSSQERAHQAPGKPWVLTC